MILILFKKTTRRHNAISPVIGVILIVAVVVALVTFVSLIVFNISDGSISDTPDASVSLEQTGDVVEVTVLRNENVDSFIVQYTAPDGTRTSKSISGDPGESTTVAEGDGTYQVIAILDDSSKQVLDEKVYNNTGVLDKESVQLDFNPPAQGVIIRAYDNGSRVDSDTSDRYGNINIATSVDEYRIANDTGAEYTLTTEPSATSYSLQNDAGLSDKDVTDFLMAGAGTSSNPYKIEYASDLQALQYDPNVTADIVNDINASHTSDWNDQNGFKPLGSYGSRVNTTLNGNNHEINNLRINRSSESITGLFSYVRGGLTVKDLDFNNAVVKGSTRTGVIIGDADDYGSEPIIVEDLYIDSSLTTGTGGGNIAGEIRDFDASSWVYIRNITATGRIYTDGNDVGGIAGVTKNVIMNNVSYLGPQIGNTNDGGRHGGIIGEHKENLSIDGAEVNAKIYGGYSNNGGVVGELGTRGKNNTITNATFSGEVISDGAVAGGLVGYIRENSNVTNSYSTGYVEGSRQVGGLIGSVHEGNIRGSYATGNVEGTGRSVGGLVGDSRDTDYSDVYATGNVNATGNNDVGGLFGSLSDGNVSTSYATGNVLGDFDTGGLVGDLSRSNVSKSYATGNIKGRSRVGGVVGGSVYGSANKISKSYYVGGTIEATEDAAGGIVGGFESGTVVVNTYSVADISVSNDSKRGVLVGSMGDAESSAILRDSYALEDTSLKTSERVIGSTGYYEDSAVVTIKQGSNVLASDEYVNVSEIDGELIDNFTQTQNEMTGSDAATSMTQFDFSNTWETASGDYPVLADLDRKRQLNHR